MASKMRGGSHAQHVKAGKQSHKNDTKQRTSRGGHSARRTPKETAVPAITSESIDRDDLLEESDD